MGFYLFRESHAGYYADWHMSGDPTLIIIQSGVLRITLQKGKYKDFTSGEMFITADNVPIDVIFDDALHGHQAKVIGNETLKAIHIKFDGWSL